MTKIWDTAVAEAADSLGAMLMQCAEGTAEHGYDDIAAAALVAGLSVLLGAAPSEDRLAQSARALHSQLHPGEEEGWGRLDDGERSFWLDAARAALEASDRALLREVKG